MNSKYNERDLRLDVIKGIAILLVVLGHSIQWNVNNFDDNVVFRLIYSFHMPLFMFISGYIASFIKKFNLLLIKKKFQTLVIPYIFWAVFNFIIEGIYNKMSFYQYIQAIIEHPDLGLWFLWILFLNFCVLTLVLNLSKFNKYQPGLIIIGLLFILSLKFNVLGISLLARHFVYFYIGFVLANNILILRKYEKKILITSIICFIILVTFWHRTKGPLFMLNVNFFTSDNPLVKEIYTIFYDYITAFSGILMVFYTVPIVKLSESKALAWLGKITLDVYVFHFLFSYRLGSGVAEIMTTFLIALIGAIIMSFLVRKSFTLSKLLLGHNYVEKLGSKPFNEERFIE